MGRGLDTLPEFATDDEIASALVGARRAPEVKAMFRGMESEGFPAVDARFGGRYVPAVRRYLDNEYGLADSVPTARDGAEDLSAWSRPTKRRA